MKYNDLIELIEEFAPTEWFEDEDNSGIQVHCGREDIDRVLVCLEINDAVLEEAKATKADMIITHHPLLFHPVNKITPETPVGRYLLAAITAGIDVYSSHLAFDTAEKGNNVYLAELLKLEDVALPEGDWDDDDEEDELEDELDEGGDGFDEADPDDPDDDSDDEYEYDVDEVGSMGRLPVPMSFGEFCTYVERCMDLPKNYIRCVDGGKETLEKVAFCTGAGGDFIYTAVREGCDAYITGDLKLHEAQYAKAMGLTVIDAGHYGTEKIFTENFAAQLRARAQEQGEKLEVIEAEADTNPYTL